MESVDRRTAIMITAATSLAAVAAAAPVSAHTGQATGGALSGLAHPLLGPDHVAAMVTVGILAAVLRRPFVMPACFLGAMTVGGALGVMGLALPGREFAVAASVVALGASLVAAHRSGPEATMFLVAFAGLVHGHAHGVEAPSAVHPSTYVAGFLVATATCHALGVMAGTRLALRPRARATTGAVVAGLGLGLLVGLI